MIPTTCSVALPLPAAHPYRYTAPRALADRIVPGARVVVPVRGREMVGIVVSTGDDEAPDLRPVLLAPDPRPIMPVSLLELARWVASYYATPLGLTMRAMLPGALWGASRLVAIARAPESVPGGAGADVYEAIERAGGRVAASRLTRMVQRPVWDVLQRLERAGAVTLETEAPRLGPGAGKERVVILTRSLPVLMEREQVFGRAVRQRAAYDIIDELGGEALWSHLVRHVGFSPAVLHGLVARSVARIEERERLRDPFAGVETRPPDTLNPDQCRAVEALGARERGAASLLFGVTGSGKTAVYLEAVRRDAAAGRGVIVLVPEIALTPQTVARVRGVFGDAVSVLHSGLSDAERADAWRAVAGGQRHVVVGARSAVFAPVRDLAAIVLDEEHDASYKHGKAPRYHAKEVALARARADGARVVLASATPSLETWAQRDRIAVVTLPERIGARPLPPVTLIDLTTVPRVPRSQGVPWSEALDRAVEARLAAGEQVLLLLNRRGFAHYVHCPACGLVQECPNCSIALTVHQHPERLRCHYCDHSETLAPVCDACGHETRRTRGIGTQSLEEWLETRFPRARLARMDADTTTRKWSHRRILDAMGAGAIDILFGTQMIAKGLDFPSVTLVGVVDADTGLHLPDFRAAERTFQLIAQVAGRAGRGPRGGEVLVQTRSARHPALTAARDHDFAGFAERELAQRQAPAYPPHVGLVRVIVSGPDETGVGRAADELSEWFRGLIRVRGLEAVEVVGPAPAPLARVKRRWRWHLLLRSGDRQLLGKIQRYAARQAPYVRRGPVRVSFDRDPVSVL